MQLDNEFQSVDINGRMPWWFYFVETAILMVRRSKKVSRWERGVPQVRPIGMGNVGRRANGKAVAALHRNAVCEICLPQQVAVGAGSGVQKLAFGMRTMMEQHPMNVTIDIDKPNAYNELKRTSMINAAASHPEMAALGRYAHATMAPESVIANGTRSRNLCARASSEDGQQGDAIVCSVYSLATLPALQALDQDVAQSGGIARGFVDDIFVNAPIEAIFVAVATYERLLPPDEEGLNRDKMVCYCPALGAQPAEHPGLRQHATVEDEDGVPTTRIHGIRLAGDGIEIVGVFIGREEYIIDKVTRESVEKASSMNTISTQLRPSRARVLYTLVEYCVQSKLESWTGTTSRRRTSRATPWPASRRSTPTFSTSRWARWARRGRSCVPTSLRCADCAAGAVEGRRDSVARGRRTGRIRRSVLRGAAEDAQPARGGGRFAGLIAGSHGHARPRVF